MIREVRKKSVKNIVINIMLMISFSCYCQNVQTVPNATNYIKDTHLKCMLNFLVENSYYDEIGVDVYEHYRDNTQGFFIVNDLYIKKYDIYGYHFYSGEAHAAEFIMLINKKADNILVLGYGDFDTNKSKLVDFLNNNVIGTIDRDEVLYIILEKLKQIYPNRISNS